MNFHNEKMKRITVIETASYPFFNPLHVRLEAALEHSNIKRAFGKGATVLIDGLPGSKSALSVPFVPAQHKQLSCLLVVGLERWDQYLNITLKTSLWFLFSSLAPELEKTKTHISNTLKESVQIMERAPLYLVMEQQRLIEELIAYRAYAAKIHNAVQEISEWTKEKTQYPIFSLGELTDASTPRGEWIKLLNLIFSAPDEELKEAKLNLIRSTTMKEIENLTKTTSAQLDALISVLLTYDGQIQELLRLQNLGLVEKITTIQQILRKEYAVYDHVSLQVRSSMLKLQCDIASELRDEERISAIASRIYSYVRTEREERLIAMLGSPGAKNVISKLAKAGVEVSLIEESGGEQRVLH